MSKEIKKVIKDGETAVIYHPEFGLGWYTYHNIRDLLFDPKLVELILHPNFENMRFANPGNENYDKELDDKIIEYCKEVNERKYVIEKYGRDEEEYIYKCYDEDNSLNHYIYFLDIYWVEVGKKFVISNYDGEETVYVEDEDEDDWNYA